MARTLQEIKVPKLHYQHLSTKPRPNYNKSNHTKPNKTTAKLRIPSEHPWNSEPANLRSLVDTFFTPNDVFFVRNHNPVPILDEVFIFLLLLL